MNDNVTNISDIKAIVKTFCQERNWDQFHGAKDLAIGIVTEASELLDIFRFKNDSDIRKIMDTPEDLKRVKDELADVLFFVTRFAQMNGIDLSTALKDKIAANEKKYSVGLSKNSNLKYDKLKK